MSDDDTFGYDEDDDDEPEAAPQPAAQDSSVIKQLRRELRAAQKNLKAKDTELETAKTYREKYLSTQVPQMFEEQGLPKNLTKLYLSSIGEQEPTVESLKTWATEYEITPTSPPEAQQTQGAEATFTPTVGGEPPGTAKYDRATIDAMIKRGGPEGTEAFRAIQEGRVVWNNPEQIAESMRK